MTSQSFGVSGYHPRRVTVALRSERAGSETLLTEAAEAVLRRAGEDPERSIQAGSGTDSSGRNDGSESHRGPAQHHRVWNASAARSVHRSRDAGRTISKPSVPPSRYMADTSGAAPLVTGRVTSTVPRRARDTGTTISVVTT